MMGAPVLVARNLSFAYRNGRRIFADLNLALAAGECLAIMGSSGCGKSTLLYCLSGIIPQYYFGKMTGHVEVLGKDISAYKQEEFSQIVGMVFQNPSNRLFTQTVEDEMSFGLQNLCLPEEEIYSRIDQTLHDLGIEALRFQNPAQLSGGQQQLVTLAVALVMHPKLCFLDEVFSQLDSEGRGLLMERLLWLKTQEVSIVMVDHSAENTQIADRVLNLQAISQ